jgi:hypothetical protein
MIRKGRKNRHQYFFGILNRFQGLGFIISTDNPITINDYFLFEVRFLWLKFWYCYELTRR